MTSARDSAIIVEARVRAHSKRADGGRNISLQIHPHDELGGVDRLEIGQRLSVAMVPLKDDPEGQAKTASRDDTTRQTLGEDKTGAHRLYALVGLTRRDPLFLRYISAPDVPDSDAYAASHIRTVWCKGTIQSCSEIKPGTQAADLFLHEYDKFDAWKKAPRHGG